LTTAVGLFCAPDTCMIYRLPNSGVLLADSAKLINLTTLYHCGESFGDRLRSNNQG